jgi:hypothetical protein
VGTVKGLRGYATSCDLVAAPQLSYSKDLITWRRSHFRHKLDETHLVKLTNCSKLSVLMSHEEPFGSCSPKRSHILMDFTSRSSRKFLG